MMPTVDQIDVLLSTLNSTEVGTLDSIAGKLRQVRDELLAREQPDLAERAEDAVKALGKGDVAEFKRLRAFLQSKLGHLRR